MHLPGSLTTYHGVTLLQLRDSIPITSPSFCSRSPSYGNWQTTALQPCLGRQAFLCNLEESHQAGNIVGARAAGDAPFKWCRHRVAGRPDCPQAGRADGTGWPAGHHARGGWCRLPRRGLQRWEEGRSTAGSLLCAGRVQGIRAGGLCGQVCRGDAGQALSALARAHGHLRTAQQFWLYWGRICTGRPWGQHYG